jgi:SAM-dependent methyltransferase
MIAVARAVPFRAGPQIEWHVMEAGTLGLAAGTVDLVLCAQTLQFVEDLVGAVREMRRVLRKGGRVALSVWCGLRENPYSEALVSAIARRIGEEPAAGFAAAFGLSDADEIRRLLWAAGFAMVEVTKREIEARLPELRRFVPAHVGATAMAASFHSASAEIRETVVSEMEERLASYATEAEVRVPFRTHLAMGRL